MSTAKQKKRPQKVSARKVVLVSFLVDLIDVVTNLVVAVITGSATVFGEMAQGIADSIGSVLLVVGERRARRPASDKHPLGHAREAFFWGLLSAVTMLLVGAGLSAWRGIQQLIEPEPIDSVYLAIAVIVVAVFTNGYAVKLSAQRIISELGGLKAIFSNYSHPLVKGAFLRDVVGVTTSVLGLAALWAYQIFQLPIFDAIGALVAAAFMFSSSIFLLIQFHGLITGQTLPPKEVDQIKRCLLKANDVVAVNYLVAIYAGASEIMIEVDLDLSEGLNTSEIEKLMDILEERVRLVFPTLHRVRFVLNSPIAAKR